MSNPNPVVTSAPGSGAGDVVREDARNEPAATRYHGPQLLQVLHQDGKKTTVPAVSKAPMANRPIAPAPGPPAVHHSGPVGTATPHNIVTKVPTALMSGGVEVGHSNTATVNMSALQHAAVAATATTTQLSIPTPVGLVSSGPTLVQATGLSVPHHVKQVSMASLIRSAAIPQVATQQFTSQAHPVATGTSAIPQHQPVVHAFPPHVPRGAVQASQLAVSKTAPLAAPAVRVTTPSAIQLTTVPSASNPGVQTIQHQLHSQPKALLPVQTAGPTTPTPNRSGSPQITLPSAVEHRLPATAFHRPLLGHQTGTTPTVQITIQQPPRTIAPMLSQQPKVVQSPGTAQKQIMSQATVPPMIHQASSATISTAKLGTAHGQQFLGQVIQRPQQKMIVTTAPIIQTQNVATVTTTAKPFGITVTGALTKGQKIVMTQAPTLPTVQSTLPVNLAPHPGLDPTLRVIPGNTGATLNLAPTGIQRQKVALASQASIASTIHPTISAQPKAVQGTATVVTVNNTPTATTMPSIPVAKVQPTRQLTQTAQVAQQASVHQVSQASAPLVSNTPSVEIAGHRDGQATIPQTSLPTTIPQGSIFLSQAHRGSPNTATTQITVPTTHTDNRAADRPGIPAHMPYTALPQEYYAASIVNYQNYPNLVYQNVPAHPQAFTPIPTTMRPGIVPSQAPNLAATLQAAAHGVTGTSTQGVRVNSMMVTVDPNRHASIVQHAHYTSTAEGRTSASASEVASTISAATILSSASSQSVNAQQAPAPQPTPIANNPCASPRPSILRKRTNDGNVALVKKNLMSMGLDSNSPSTDTPHHPAPSISPKSSIPCDPSRENSQSSTDTATSSESPPAAAQTPELRKEIKQEPMDITENGTTPAGPPTAGTNSMEASPRKKPRKQLLNANKELKDGTSTDEEMEKLSLTPPEVKRELEKAETIRKEEEYVDDEGVRWVAERKRPNISLLNHYACTWKARNNHFLKQSDVKPKEERRPTVNELANQRAVIQKASGWKLYHLAAQLEELVDLEKDVRKKMAEVQEAIAPKHIAKHTMEDDIGMVHEITQGNIQRSQLMIDQLDEAKTAMTKILNHKTRIMEIITKHHSKRPVKKKERT